MIETLFELIKLEYTELFYFGLSSLIGIYIKTVLSFLINQNYLKSLSSFLLFGLLPPVGYLITDVISSNIALSLGMVGALSIVRFRTPVKNPLELVNYFMLITIGIVLNARPNSAINFCIYIGIAAILFRLFMRFFSNNKAFMFLVEGISDEAYQITIETKSEINTEQFESNFKHKSSDGTKFMYAFSAKNKQVVDEIFEKFPKEEIIKYSIDR